MKNLLITLLFFGFTILMGAQSTPTVGDVLVINAPNAQTYRYIKFPKLNTLNKRGVVANYKSVFGNHVVIDEVITKEDGTTQVILKKKDGSKFFGFLSTVKANYAKALEAKEIMLAI